MCPEKQKKIIRKIHFSEIKRTRRLTTLQTIMKKKKNIKRNGNKAKKKKKEIKKQKQLQKFLFELVKKRIKTARNTFFYILRFFISSHSENNRQPKI